MIEALFWTAVYSVGGAFVILALFVAACVVSDVIADERDAARVRRGYQGTKQGSGDVIAPLGGTGTRPPAESEWKSRADE